MKLPRVFGCALLAISTIASAVTLPEGLDFDPPQDLDLTYQVVPSFDAREKVIARWEGEQLQYLVSVQPLPSQYLDAKVYLNALARDLKKATGRIEVGETVTYDGAPGFKATAVEITLPATAKRPAVHQAMHFLTDGQQSFLGIAVLMSNDFELSRMLSESAQVLHGVHPAGADQPREKRDFEGQELVGDWQIHSVQPDGRSAVAQVHLDQDGTFTTQVTLDGRLELAGAGLWHRQGDKLHWTYVNTVPPLPESAREDMDIITAEAPQQLTLSSARGARHTMTRVQKPAPFQDHGNS